MDIKNILKSIKENENTISMVMGTVVLIVAGIFVIKYFRNIKTGEVTSTKTTAEIQKHTVAQGETLWSIAEKYYKSGFKWTDIQKTNKITDPSKLEKGQQLEIPNIALETTKPVTPTPTIAPTPSPKPTIVANLINPSSPISGASYTVVQGDNLWTIAVRAYGDGYKWTQIARENKLVNPSIIHSGNVLILSR